MAGRVSFIEIKRRVCREFRAPLRCMTSNGRWPSFARPRMTAMYLARRHTRLTLSTIGRLCGGRDHSTVINALRRIEELRDADQDLDGMIRAVERELEAA